MQTDHNSSSGSRGRDEIGDDAAQAAAEAARVGRWKRLTAPVSPDTRTAERDHSRENLRHELARFTSRECSYRAEQNRWLNPISCLRRAAFDMVSVLVENAISPIKVALKAGSPGRLSSRVNLAVGVFDLAEQTVRSGPLAQIELRIEVMPSRMAHRGVMSAQDAVCASAQDPCGYKIRARSAKTGHGKAIHLLTMYRL